MNFIDMTLATLVGLLPIANPLSTAALFLGITRDDTPEERRHQALMGCLYMFGILVVFLVLGTAIMEFFGISISGLRIAGGLMVARVAMSMLNAKGTNIQSEAKREAVEKSDVSFTPLAMPSLSGPGAIAITIGMASEADYFMDYIAILVGIVAVCLISWFALKASTKVLHFLGTNGVNAISRIMGFLLLCVGVQFIVNGVLDIVTQQEFLARLAEAFPG